MFCPKCGSLLMPKKLKDKKVMICTCGYTDSDISKSKLKDKIKETARVEVIEKNVDVHPILEIECPKCGHNKAYFMTMQTRAGDEPETKFYKCEKCGSTWRDYS